MPTTVLLPNADVTTNWDTTAGSGSAHYDRVSEGTSSPTDTNYVETTTLGDDDRYEFSNTPANTNTVTQVVVRTRCGIIDSGSAAYIAVSLYHSGNPGTQVGSTQNITTANIGFNDGTLATVNKTFSGLSLTKTQADGLQVRYVFNNV